MIRMGCCCLSSPEIFRDFFQFPFDYAEFPLKALHLYNSTDLDDVEAKLLQNGRQAEVFKNFFPNEMILVGKEANRKEILSYVEKSLPFFERFHTQIGVIGSGKSRKIPEGYTKADADEAFGEIVYHCCDRLKEVGVFAVLEPLNRKETNYINTVFDSAEFSKRVNHPNLGFLVDFYHFSQNEEKLDDLEVFRGNLCHVHVARPGDRLPPKKEDTETVRAWADALHNLNYDGRVSLEAKHGPGLVGDVEDYVAMFPLFQKENK